MTPTPWTAYLCLSASMLLVGSYVGLSKLLLGVFPVFLLALLRFGIAALAMLPWLRAERGSQPLRAFMQKNVREKDLKLFVDMAKETEPSKPEDLSLRVLVPAFMISELKRAFEIGFLLFLPFLIIDLVVASVLMSMGMMMLPPVVVSLPFKLIFFVLVDGWSLVAGSLIQSYGS